MVAIANTKMMASAMQAHIVHLGRTLPIAQLASMKTMVNVTSALTVPPELMRQIVMMVGPRRANMKTMGSVTLVPTVQLAQTSTTAEEGAAGAVNTPV